MAIPLLLSCLLLIGAGVWAGQQYNTLNQMAALMAQELTAIQQQCEDYQHAVEKLSKQVIALAALVKQADRRSTEREKQLSDQLTRLQTTLKQLPYE